MSDDGAEPVDAAFRREHSWVRFTRGPARGPASNRNHGASLARRPWLAFTDDDCRPSPGWLSAYAAAAASAGDRVVLEGRVVADRARRAVDEEAPLNDSGGLLWSCNLAIGAAAFRELGGFCEDYSTAAMEDVDLRYRLERHGFTLRFVPEAVVVHPWRRIEWGRLVRQRDARLLFYSRHPELLPDAVRLWGESIRFPVRSLYHTARIALQVRGAGFPRGLLLPLAEARFWTTLLWRTRLGSARVRRHP